VTKNLSGEGGGGGGVKKKNALEALSVNRCELAGN